MPIFCGMIIRMIFDLVGQVLLIDLVAFKAVGVLITLVIAQRLHEFCGGVAKVEGDFEWSKRFYILQRCLISGVA